MKLEAILDGCTPRKDGSMSLRFVTQEIPNNEKGAIIEFLNRFGWLLFITDPDFEEVPTQAPENDLKSPSERLRSVIYCKWKQDGGVGDFNQFYRETMEKFISHVKSKLDDN